MSEGTEVDSTGSQPSLDLGARLRAQRLGQGLSLREVARRLQRSPSAISQFETGKVSATDEPAVALWCIFAVGQDRDAHRYGVRRPLG